MVLEALVVREGGRRKLVDALLGETISPISHRPYRHRWLAKLSLAFWGKTLDRYRISGEMVNGVLFEVAPSSKVSAR